MDPKNYFTSIAYKRLVAVDLPGAASNQHELNGVSGLRLLFQTDGKVQGAISWFYFAENEPVRESKGRFTFYDARAKSAARTGRSEWRLYYEGGFLSYARIGDVLLIGLTPQKKIVGLIFQNNSTWLKAAEAFFGLNATASDKFDVPLIVGSAPITDNLSDQAKKQVEALAKSLNTDEKASNNVESTNLLRTERLPFKPRARMLVLLGDQLIRDAGIAVFELAKNAYDADASKVELVLSHVTDLANASVMIEDDGYGMSWDTIVNVWLEPGTDYRQLQKHNNIRSPKYERLPLGEKGIGRFAAHKLGKKIRLITKKAGHAELVVEIDWNEFTTAHYLSDAQVKVSEREPEHFTEGKTGTRIEICDLNEELSRGTIRQIHRAITSICSPFKGPSEFIATIKVLPDNSPLEGLLHLDQVLELAPYRATCLIEGRTLTYDYDFVPSSGMERISGRSVRDLKIDIPGLDMFAAEDFKNKIGDVMLEFRIYDLDSQILEFSVTDKKGFKAFLQNTGGVRVYRDGVRVYDYGEPGNDWLDLGGSRVNAPTERISNNQIIGAIHVSGEASVGLIEKTNREGFVEDSTYELFRKIVVFALAQIVLERNLDKERLRAIYAKKSLKEPVIADLARLREMLEPFSIQAPDLMPLVDGVAKQYKEMRDTLLTAAGSGLALSVVIHEVEKAIKGLAIAVERDSPVEEMRALAIHLNELIEGLTYLTRKSGRKNELFIELVKLTLFNTGYRTRSHRITITNGLEAGDPNLSVRCTRRLVITTLMNLIDNSIYWLSTKGSEEKEIYIGSTNVLEGGPVLFVADNGPGFQDPPESLVGPFMSRKPEGMGLGLHIANEVMKSHGGALIFPRREDIGLDETFSGAIVGLQFKDN
jgi:signal transduction histidine kinase